MLNINQKINNYGINNSPKIYSCIYEALKDNGLNDEEIDNIITFLRF